MIYEETLDRLEELRVLLKIFDLKYDVFYQKIGMKELRFIIQKENNFIIYYCLEHLEFNVHRLTRGQTLLSPHIMLSPHFQACPEQY